VPGTLIICATPIGNLGDVSPRLAEALGSADVIFAEDTRRTSTLTNHLGLDVPLRSYFAGNQRRRDTELDRCLAEGATVALVSDAGTPVVSDPGRSAVQAAVEAGAVVTVIPGPSAVTGALAVSGMDGDRFVFEGFLPKKGRDRADRIELLVVETRTVVLFVAPHQLVDDLTDLAEALGGGRRVCIVRELTKMHEEVVWSTLDRSVESWSERGGRGEFTLVLAGAEPQVHGIDEAVELARRLMDNGAPPSEAAREAAGEMKVARREVYRRIVGA
jgi:16S rRNA (cytidine1402-2'-O)-methyltransferase